MYTRDTPLLQKATANYITKYYLIDHDIPLACYVTVNQSDSFNISCDLQPIRFLQHVMWPSTNHIPIAHHVTFDQSSAASFPDFHNSNLQDLQLIVCTVSNESWGHETRMKLKQSVFEQSHLLSNCTTITMPPGNRGRLRILSHMNHEAPTATPTLPYWVFVNKSSKWHANKPQPNVANVLLIRMEYFDSAHVCSTGIKNKHFKYQETTCNVERPVNNDKNNLHSSS